MTKECIFINTGQAGVQLANAIWELFCLEHSVGVDGTVESTVSTSNDNNDTLSCLYYETEYGKVVPRALYIDMEPTTIDEVRVGPYRSLFDPFQLISGKEDAGSNYARGRITLGKCMEGLVMETLRQQIENCDSLQGFMVCHAFGGGTGSGFTAHIMEKILTDYGKKAHINFGIYPSPQCTNSVVEPYNSMLTLSSALNMSDCCFIFDNEALYNIARRGLCFEYPTYSNINRIMAQMLSCVIGTPRFEGSLTCDLTCFMTNLVPYPRIHFPMISHAPLLNMEKMYHEKITTTEITKACFLPHCQAIRCDPLHGKYMACCWLYRGDVTPREINLTMQYIRSRQCIHFVDWSPSGFKISICNTPPVTVPGSELCKSTKSVTMAANTTALAEAFARLNHKVDLMYSRRAFVHWYISEGMEEGEFTDTREETGALEQDYEAVGAEEGEEAELSPNFSTASYKKSSRESAEQVRNSSIKNSSPGDENVEGADYGGTDNGEADYAGETNGETDYGGENNGETDYGGENNGETDYEGGGEDGQEGESDVEAPVAEGYEDDTRPDSNEYVSDNAEEEENNEDAEAGYGYGETGETGESGYTENGDQGYY